MIKIKIKLKYIFFCIYTQKKSVRTDSIIKCITRGIHFLRVFFGDCRGQSHFSCAPRPKSEPDPGCHPQPPPNPSSEPTPLSLPHSRQHPRHLRKQAQGSEQHSLHLQPFYDQSFNFITKYEAQLSHSGKENTQTDRFAFTYCITETGILLINTV